MPLKSYGAKIGNFRKRCHVPLVIDTCDETVIDPKIHTQHIILK